MKLILVVLRQGKWGGQHKTGIYNTWAPGPVLLLSNYEQVASLFSSVSCRVKLTAL